MVTSRLAQKTLAPAAALYGSLVRIRNAAYDRGLLKSSSVALPVVCIGNAIVGGKR